MALGASPRAVAAMVVRQGMRPVFAGIALGTAVAALVTRVLRSQLHGVSATDLPTFAIVVAVVTLAAVAAAYLPARRAADTDPKDAIRA